MTNFFISLIVGIILLIIMIIVIALNINLKQQNMNKQDKIKKVMCEFKDG